VVDQAFEPGIKKGELEVTMLQGKPVKIKRKTPQKESFGATLRAGGVYTKGGELDISDPEFESVRSLLRSEAGLLMDNVGLGALALPLLWNVELIPADRGEAGAGWVIGEIDCECIGISTQLDLCKPLAETAIQICRGTEVPPLVLPPTGTAEL
jgi:hypothetical protein